MLAFYPICPVEPTVEHSSVFGPWSEAWPIARPRSYLDGTSWLLPAQVFRSFVTPGDNVRDFISLAGIWTSQDGAIRMSSQTSRLC